MVVRTSGSRRLGPTVIRALFALTLLLISSPGQAVERLHLSTGATPPWGPGDGNPGYLKLVTEEAFRRIGVQVEIAQIPAERVLENVNRGIDDGDIFRIAGMEKAYPNLVMVPEPIANFEFTALTLAGGRPFVFSGWPSLEGMEVGLMTGWKFYEKQLTPATHTTYVANPSLLIGILRDKKVDVVLFERWMGAYTAAKAGVAIQKVDPPFAKMPMHIYLNKKYAGVVGKVSSALAGMRADGTLRRIEETSLKGFERK